MVRASCRDVGCGVGRLAVGLTQFLGPEGRYEGFDTIEIIEKEVASVES